MQICSSRGHIRQTGVTFVISLHVMVSGFIMGFSSPTVPQIQKENLLLERHQVSWYGSLAMAGAACGGTVAGLLAHKHGRKITIMFCGIPYTVGWLLIITADTNLMLYVGRFCNGLAYGMSVPCASIYIGEISSKSVRGFMSTICNVIQMTGLLMVYILGDLLSWRWLATAGQILTTVAVMLLTIIPESPYYYLSIGQIDEARACLKYLRDAKENYLAELVEKQEAYKKEEGNNLNTFFSRHVFLPVALIAALMMFKEITGTMAVFFYLQNVMEDAGFSGNPAIPPIVIAAVRIVFAFLTSVVIDSAGRRSVLFFSSVVMFLGCFGLGLHFYLKEFMEWQSDWLPMLSLVLYIAAFSMGWAPVPWVSLGELCGNRFRGFAGGVAAFSTWATAFLISQLFDTLRHSLGSYGTFWLFAGLCLLSLLFTIKFLPETKGKSLETISQLFLRSENSNLKQNSEDIFSTRL